jgi:hypothetical protein
MTERKSIVIERRRIPLTKILHNRYIEDAIAELKAFRAKFAEDEVLYKRKVMIKYNQGECIAEVYRLETDKEYNTRLEEERQKREAKLERERKKELREQIKAEQAARDAERAAEEQRKHELATFKALYKKLGLTAKDLESI